MPFLIILALLLSSFITEGWAQVGPPAPGHVIKNGSTTLRQRPNLIFESGVCADDSASNATVCTPSTASRSLSTSGTHYLTFNSAGDAATESYGVNTLTLAGSTGTLNAFYCALSVAPGSGKSRTFTVRKNQIDTTITCTISNTDTSCNDTTHTVNVVPTDTLSIKSTVSGIPTASAVNCQLTNAANAITITDSTLTTLTGILAGNGSRLSGFTMSGDCTINTSTGAITCTKTNGTNLGPLATVATTTGSGAGVLATSPTIVTPTIAKLANLTTDGLVYTTGGDGSLGTIGLTSVTPLNPGAWTLIRSSANPIFTVNPGNPNENTEQYTPCSVRLGNGDIWVYVKGTGKIYAWKSTDNGETFTLQNSNNPVINIGAGGSWESSAVVSPACFYDLATTTIHIYYKGFDGDNNHWAWGHATASASAPQTVTKDPANPILTSANVQTQLSLTGLLDLAISDVIKIGSTYYFYGYLLDNSGNYKLFYATGSAVNNPAAQAVIVTPSSPYDLVEQPTVFTHPGGSTYIMLYAEGYQASSGVRYGRAAFSLDGTTWVPIPGRPVQPSGSTWESQWTHTFNVLKANAAPYTDAVLINGHYNIYYSGGNTNATLTQGGLIRAYPAVGASEAKLMLPAEWYPAFHVASSGLNNFYFAGGFGVGASSPNAYIYTVGNDSTASDENIPSLTAENLNTTTSFAMLRAKINGGYANSNPEVWLAAKKTAGETLVQLRVLSNHALAIYTNNVEKLRIDTAGLVTFQGQTSSFPALKRSSTDLQCRLADDSNFCSYYGKHKSSDGTAGVTVTICTGFKDGLCISGS